MKAGLNMAATVSCPAELGDSFRNLYGESCRLYYAPGRINLIGEHTDYNQGFVMPAAIQFRCWTAIASTNDRTFEIHSANLQESRRFDLDHPKRLGDWSDYVQGVALMLEQSGIRLTGARILISSEVPIGSGLSSSAALEVSAGLAMLDNQPKAWSRRLLALSCQRAESEFVGARCGIMDQFVACHARDACSILLDCRSLETQFLPIPEHVRLVICNTMVKHANAAGEYNTRRAECEAGVRLLGQKFPGLASLRELDLPEFAEAQHLLPRVLQQRCRHVLYENARVLAAAAALEKADLETLGMLMAESHRSLRDDYEVSSPELNVMVDLASRFPGTYGARMTGGGFGGCTVNLVAKDKVDEFQDTITAAYREQTGIAAETYVSAACHGAERWDGTE